MNLDQQDMERASNVHSSCDTRQNTSETFTSTSLNNSSTTDTKKSGRPPHPLWAHFHRGEKRNRYHHHAYCVYCVERYGSGHVAATRGVSIDMLRHLEKCIHCPRSVVDVVKAICVQRDAERLDKYGKKKDSVNRPDHTDDDLTSTDLPSELTTYIQHDTCQQSSSVSNEVKMDLLKLAVAAGLPSDCFHNHEFQALLRYVIPSCPSNDVFTSVLDPHFITECAQQLANVQLDCVKQGMMKGGLTLSVHTWITLNGQYMVAFNLINSNQDAACIRVIDMMSTYTSQQLAIKMEQVLQYLEQTNITIMGIVVDSMVALNAAKRIGTQRSSLLIIPCFSRLLSILAGFVLTSDPMMRDTVNDMIEIALYFQNPVLKQVFIQHTGTDCLLPHRGNWFSFIETAIQLNQSKSQILKICETCSSLRQLVDTSFWNRLDRLLVFLLPLQESYHVLSVYSEFTLAHIMYQLGRMRQQYMNLTDTMDSTLAHQMIVYIDAIWRQYEMPVMLLAYAFHFHFDSSIIPMETLVLYVEQYRKQWFNQVDENLHDLVDSFLFPFDTNDISSLSESHPQIYSLCCRMYTITVSTINLTPLIDGIGYVPSIARTVRSPERIEILLHIGFACNLEKQNIRCTFQRHDTIRTGREWHGFANQWLDYCTQELNMEEYDTLHTIETTSLSSFFTHSLVSMMDKLSSV